MDRKRAPSVRFSISLPPKLMEQLDKMMLQKGRENRSQLISEMIRNQLIEHQSQQGQKEMAGTITLVYDHHTPHVQSELTRIQHDLHNCILSTTHVHLDHDNCLEVLIVRGKANLIRSISERIFSCKGIKHGKLTITGLL
ncbi:MAG TPA: nickel-responsive transcriptional regulator NikR [Verrucomicrobiota bacterium]|nr:nickel-responsive transcriptional regulator NikR [Verrucomicrobiota bacterium]